MSEGSKETASAVVSEFLRREDVWLAVVIVLAVLFVLGLVFGLVPLFFGPGDSRDRMEIYYKSALIGGALVTFATVMWRGLIASRQADQQREQLGKIQTQIKQSEEDNLANLLQTGADMVSEADKDATVAAGIATLTSVAKGANESFAIAAMDVLAFYVESISQEGHLQPNTSAAIDALASTFRETGRSSNRSIVCPGNKATGEVFWMPIIGASAVLYIGGQLVEKELTRTNLARRVDFVEVELNNCTKIVVSDNYNQCNFVSCAIDGFFGEKAIGNEYHGCNFSGTVFEDDIPPNVHGGLNYYFLDDPPVIQIGDDPNHRETATKIPSWLRGM